MSIHDQQDNSNRSQSQAANWASLHLWHMQPVRDVLLGLGIFALIMLAQKASVVTVPLLLAILFAYLFEPVICWIMNKLNWSRKTSVISIMVGIITLIILPAVLGTTYAIGQLISFGTETTQNYNHLMDALEADDQAGQQLLESNEVPELWIWSYNEIRKSETQDSLVGESLAAATDWITENTDHVAQTAAGVSMEAVNSILGFIGAAFGLSFMAFVTAFFFFFTATEWVKLKGFGANLLPDKNRDSITDLLVKFDRVISGFIRGRITIAFIQSIIFSIGFFLIGVPGAFILGPLVAVLSIVPYLALVGVPIAISLLWLQGYPPESFRSQIWWIVGAPTAFYFIGQAIDDYILTPMIQGKSTGMDTPTILFASLAGGALFGVFGLLIAIPIAACVKILIQEIFWPKFKDWAEGRAADPLPIETK